jgi:pimeloyl-ACP methyl ester carboxylesterase
LHVVSRPSSSGGAGEARRLVLVHGSMDRASSFSRLMSRLGDFSVDTYDRRGYGGSASLGPASFDEQVGDLVAVLNGAPAVVFGHSFGANVVLAAAAAYPSLVPAAFVWEPPQPWLAWWPGSSVSAGAALATMAPQDQAEWFMRRVVGDRVWERLPESTRRQRRAEGPALQAEMASLRDGPVFDAAQVKIPVMVGRGGRSKVHQRRSSRELAASLPHAELVEIPDAAHGAHLTHPAELAALVRRAAGAS